MRICLKYIVCFFLILSASWAKASHIVGGEITYKHLGGTSYQIVIDIYQDCKDGQQAAIDQDNPALIGIFRNDANHTQIILDSIGSDPLTGNFRVPANFSNSCINNPPSVCLNRERFVKNYTLPVSPTGYTVIYQRCCRNASIVNIKEPGNTGATYFCIIPPTPAVSNNSAVFTNYPPQIICANVPLVYDHSATDADGDSLSYEFCEAYRGGGPNDAKPNPEYQFSPVLYSAPFSAINPMGGSPKIQIDPVTGLITGTPTSQNRFVVTVCCHEWRNGSIINTVTREFQFVVTNCSKAVIANTPVFSDLPNTYIVNCIDKTVKFLNTSTGGFEYFWDFGVNGQTSTEFEPTFTYPDTGTYQMKLIVNPGSTCPDSITRTVKIFPDFKGEYSFTGLHCPNVPFQFVDLSSSTYGPVSFWNWDFGDAQFSLSRNTSHSYAVGGVYNVSLISGNAKGCRDTTVKTIEVEKFMPDAGNDTTIVKGESLNFLATGGVSYYWSPAENLDNVNIPNPTGRFPEVGYFRYNVHVTSMNQCEGDDSIIVRVVGQASQFVPNAFTPNDDGVNDIFRPRAVGIRSVEAFRVFNRFGEMVFESKNFEDGWDGTYKGEKADIGTYMYMLQMTDRFGAEQVLKGDVILMR